MCARARVFGLSGSARSAPYGARCACGAPDSRTCRSCRRGSAGPTPRRCFGTARARGPRGPLHLFPLQTSESLGVVAVVRVWTPCGVCFGIPCRLPDARVDISGGKGPEERRGVWLVTVRLRQLWRAFCVRWPGLGMKEPRVRRLGGERAEPRSGARVLARACGTPGLRARQRRESGERARAGRTHTIVRGHGLRGPRAHPGKPPSTNYPSAAV